MSIRLTLIFLPVQQSGKPILAQYCRHSRGKNCCKNLQLVLDLSVRRASIEVSPPIQFRIEWADSQGMSPLLGRRPI